MKQKFDIEIQKYVNKNINNKLQIGKVYFKKLLIKKKEVQNKIHAFIIKGKY